MKCHIPSEAERLEKYFAKLTEVLPYITEKEVEGALKRPCKYRKIIEEKKNNPDAAG